TLEIVAAYVEKPDGTRLAVDPAAIALIDGDSAKGETFTRDQKARRVTFSRLAVGDTIVLTTRLTQKRDWFFGHFVHATGFARTEPYLESSVRLIASKDFPARIVVRGTDIEHHVTEEANAVEHLLHYHPRPRVAAEPGQTSPRDRDPQIVIT